MLKFYYCIYNLCQQSIYFKFQTNRVFFFIYFLLLYDICAQWHPFFCDVKCSCSPFLMSRVQNLSPCRQLRLKHLSSLYTVHIFVFHINIASFLFIIYEYYVYKKRKNDTRLFYRIIRTLTKHSSWLTNTYIVMYCGYILSQTWACSLESNSIYTFIYLYLYK